MAGASLTWNDPSVMGLKRCSVAVGGHTVEEVGGARLASSACQHGHSLGSLLEPSAACGAAEDADKASTRQVDVYIVFICIYICI